MATATPDHAAHSADGHRRDDEHPPPPLRYLLPPSPREWLPPGHLSYFLLDVVGQMELAAIRARYERELRGMPPHDPQMMVTLLRYGYCVGVPSSRKIERKTHEDVAFRVIAGGTHPDHQQAGLVNLGQVAIDGTKLEANASKHKAMSYDRMMQNEAELAAKVAALLAAAERVDADEDVRSSKHRHGDELPAQLRRAQTRLARIRELEAELEAEARAQHETKVAAAGAAETARPAAGAGGGQARAEAVDRRSCDPRLLPSRMGLSSSRSSCVVLAVALASCGGEPRPAEGPRPPRPPGPPALAADDRPIATVSVATLDRTSGPVRRDAALPVEATVLVVSATGQEPELAAIRSMLLYRGVPHEVFVATAESPLTADRLRTGGHGRYQATILTSSSLADGEQSALSAAEWAVLAEYEQTFAVRRAVLAAWPDPALGFAAFTTQDTSASPLAVNCTAAGAAVFRDVACTISQQIAADPAYLATPAAGAPLTPLVTDAAGHALAAIHRGVDGREALLLMTRQHPAHLHTLVFLHGVLGWVTGGTYLGERRIELSVQLDDLFLPTPTWAGGVYRLSAADLRAARAWQAGRRRHPSTPELRLSWAFNGEGTAAGDPLTIEARDHSREWHWMNHTLNHHDLDALRYTDAYTQLAANIVIAGNLRLAGFDREAFVGPAYSGLVNPESLRAAHDLGVRYMFMDTSQVGCDSSPNTGFYNTYRPDILLVPRRPTNLYYNASTPTQWVDEYNSIYRAHWGRDLTYAEVLEQESETLVRYLLRGEADPWMFHQANLRAYDGVRSLLGDLLDVTLTKLEARLKVPVATPPASDIGRRFARRLDYDAAGVRATLFRGRALVIDAARPVSVPITGGRAADGEAYGGDVVRLVTVQPGTSTCVPLDDEGRGCDPAPVRAGGPGPTSALPIGVCDNGSTAVYAPAAGGVSVTPVPRGSSWRYWDRGGLDGAWRKPGFVDASWSTGPGPLGYGERYHATTVSYGASPTRKPITTYFRRSFTIASVDAVIALRGEVMFDDGFVVYLNGIEIERSAMAGAPVSATTLSTVYETGNEYLSFDWTAHRRRLVTGTNTIAIEVHQASSDSNDVTFDLALLAEVKAPPVGAGVAPVGAGVTPVGAGVATDAGVPVTPR